MAGGPSRERSSRPIATGPTRTHRAAPGDRHRGAGRRPGSGRDRGEVLFAGTAGASGVTVSSERRTATTPRICTCPPAVRAGARCPPATAWARSAPPAPARPTQPHLHFGVRDARSRHAYHDPLALLPPPPAAPRRRRHRPHRHPAGPGATRSRHRPQSPAPRHARAARRARRRRRPSAARRHRSGAAAAGRHPPTARTAAVARAARTGSAPRAAPSRRPAPRPGAAAPPGGRRTPGAAAPTPSAPHAPAVSPHVSHRGARHGPPQGRVRGRTEPRWALACAGLPLAAGLLGTHRGRPPRRPPARRLAGHGSCSAGAEGLERRHDPGTPRATRVDAHG